MAEEQQGEAELPPLKIDETERILARLEQVVRDRRVVLVGGQAVAIWASKCSGSEVRRRICGSGGLEGRLVESLGDAVEVLAGELPLKWGGDLLVAASERE